MISSHLECPTIIFIPESDGTKESSLPLLKGVMEVGGEGPPELNSRAAPSVHLASHPAKHMSGIEGDKGWTRSAQNTQGFTGWWFWEEEARVCVK